MCAVCEEIEKRVQVMKANKRLVYGVGFNSEGIPTSTKWRQDRFYGVWKNILAGCYDLKVQEKYPSYKGCAVSENFKDFSYFYQWCFKQVGSMQDGWHLDKDVLSKGSKIYSEDTCVFIPKELNQFLTKRKAKRGLYLIGVSYSKSLGKFYSRLNDGKGHAKHLGYFESEVDAFYAYKSAKEAMARSLAVSFAGVLDERVIQSFLNYKVSIND